MLSPEVLLCNINTNKRYIANTLVDTEKISKVNDIIMIAKFISDNKSLELPVEGETDEL